MNLFFRDANQRMLQNLFMKEMEITQARAELMKQEDEAESLENCINELQQQVDAQGKSASRNSNTKYTRDGRNEESSGTTS